MNQTQLLDLILTSFPGSTIIHQMNQPVQIKPKQLARLRGTVTRSVRSCTACDLVRGCRGPVPFSGPETSGGADWWQADGMVVGEGPGTSEDRKNQPFVGKSGKLLREVMGSAGLDVDRWVFANVVSCFPHDEKYKPRQPTMEEMWKCRGNLEAQIKAANIRYIIYAGATSLHSFRDDLKVTRVHGNVYLQQNLYVVMPILHPSTLLRRSGERKLLTEEMISEMVQLRDVMNGGSDWYGLVKNQSCVVCGKRSAEWDTDFVGYCVEHWEVEKGQDEWNRSKWSGTSEPARTRPKKVSGTSKRRGTRRQDTALFDSTPFNDLG